MLNSLRRSSMIALAAALSLAGGAPLALTTQPAMVSTAPRLQSKAKRTLFGGQSVMQQMYGKKGASISAAHQKRISRKKRNVARNRANHR